jgi:hypothetical protein
MKEKDINKMGLQELDQAINALEKLSLVGIKPN